MLKNILIIANHEQLSAIKNSTFTSIDDLLKLIFIINNIVDIKNSDSLYYVKFIYTIYYDNLHIYFGEQNRS